MNSNIRDVVHTRNSSISVTIVSRRALGIFFFFVCKNIVYVSAAAALMLIEVQELPFAPVVIFLSVVGPD